MWQKPENDQYAEELLLAGQRALPGLYKDMSTGRLVELEREDYLPASFDGRIACYVRISNTWAQRMAGVGGKHN